MKNTIIIAFILIIVVVLFIAIKNDTNNDTYDPLTENNVAEEESIEQEDSNGNSIFYTEEGFSPEKKTIEQGEKIEFTNRSQNSMWIASDPHPAHDDLPEFDQEENGEKYEFIFNETGNWEFHNHSNPQHQGRIIVE